MNTSLSKEERINLIVNAVAGLDEDMQDTYRKDFAELPDNVFVYVRELPREFHLFALQSAYVGFLAGKTATRMHLIETFLAAAGAEIQAFPKDKNEFN